MITVLEVLNRENGREESINQFQARTAPRGVCIYFQSGNLYHLNCAGVAGGPGSDLLSIIKVLSCQLMQHGGTFQLQTDPPSIAAL